jgi:hypothetical protein
VRIHGLRYAAGAWRRGPVRSDRGSADTPSMSLVRRASRLLLATVAVALAAFAGPAWPSPASPPPVPARAAATCADYPNQAAAQRAADTRDPDGDGIYCESLPCPCAGPGAPSSPPAPADPAPSQRSCRHPSAIQNITFSKTKYPNIRRHFLAARRHGWPRTLVLNRPGAEKRRDRLLEDVPTRDGFDRDEYPPAVGRGKGKGLERGRRPRGWKADVAYVRSWENRSHGSTLGLKLRRFCDGTRFRYVFY